MIGRLSYALVASLVEESLWLANWTMFQQLNYVLPPSQNADFNDCVSEVFCITHTYILYPIPPPFPWYLILTVPYFDGRCNRFLCDLCDRRCSDKVGRRRRRRPKKSQGRGQRAGLVVSIGEPLVELGALHFDAHDGWRVRYHVALPYYNLSCVSSVWI